MCSPSWETHIASDMCFPTWETGIASDICVLCSPTWETDILSDLCFPTGKGFKVDENSQTFQGLGQKCKDFLRSLPKIQGLFKTVQTLEVSLYVKVVNEYTSLICA